MTGLTKGRNTPQATGEKRRGNLAAGAMVFEGAMVMRNSAGDLVPGQAATGLVGVGRAEMRADNSKGSAGDVSIDYRPGSYRYANSAGADALTSADCGAVCYAVDDQTVAKTNGSSTRSPAGFVDFVDDVGVWVRFDEAMARLA